MARKSILIAVFAAGLFTGSFMVKGVDIALAQAGDPGVTGIGGVFFKSENPEQLRAWYKRNLGITARQQGVNFFWRHADDAARFGLTVWSLFSRDTKYFGPGGQECMVNYRVGNLDALLERLAANGVEQVGNIEDYWYGRFAWILDGEGNRVELWEPVDYPPGEFHRRAQQAGSD